MSIVFILVMKKVRDHRWDNEMGLSQTLKMCQMKGGLIYDVPEIGVKCLISLTKVNIYNFDYEHNILH